MWICGKWDSIFQLLFGFFFIYSFEASTTYSTFNFCWNKIINGKTEKVAKKDKKQKESWQILEYMYKSLMKFIDMQCVTV